MPFPPPVRYYVPLLVLVCGLAATWLDYELNLANDLSRNLKYVQAQADAVGERLARRSAKQIERFEPVSLAEDVVARPRQPWLKAVALVDENGVVIDDSDKQWVGHLARETALAPAMKLAVNADENAGHRQSRSADGAMLFGAYPFAMDRAKRVGRWSSLIAATRWHKQAPTREGSFDWLRPRLRSCVFARGQRCISALPSACG